MQTERDILSLAVSYQENTWSDITIEKTIEMVLNDIKSDKLKTQINILREKLDNGDKDFYDRYKKRLPAVTFSATFNKKRTNENLTHYNSLIVIDIDKLTDEQIINNYEQLLKDEFVISFWLSPSNKGFKGLVSIEFKIKNEEIDINQLHKYAFKKLSEYFFNQYNIILDKSGSDITRLCFLSFDQNLILKKSYKNFTIDEDEISLQNVKKVKNKIKIKYRTNKDTLYNPFEKNKRKDRELMTNIIRHLTQKSLSVTSSYEEWCKVAMAISKSFTYDIGLNYFLKLSKLDAEKYNENNCINFLNNCYQTRKGNVKFNSIIYLANQKGYLTKNQRNGVPKVEG